ncbi:hypothetical protein DV738_g2600, partial [Chaetothyriales sp. CBS 135597]
MTTAAAAMGVTWKAPRRGKAHSKAVAQGKLVETANDLCMPDFMSKYAPSAGPLPGDSEERSKYTDASNISQQELEACLDLIEHTSADDYANSELGWSRAEKRKEMALPDMKFVLLLSDPQPGTSNLSSTEGGGETVFGFISFMITYEDGQEVVYIYEVHLQQAMQGKGYGRRLIEYVEAIGESVGVGKAMLTVFRSNQRALHVYERLGYEEDEFSPQPRKLRNGTVKQPSYVILSKTLKVE